MARIYISFDTVEMMLYYWDSVSQKEKVGESYIIGLADHKDMKYLYGDEFNKESVRKVLSAISNRELVNHPTKKESRFWNYNMWMLEDLGFTNMMVKPVKTLNLDNIRDRLTKDEYNVVFVPGHVDEYYIENNTLVINFFKIVVDLNDEDKVSIACKSLSDYIEEKLTEI